MENKNIVMIRLYSGELVIGKKCESSDPGETVLSDPRSIIMVPTVRGDIHIAMKPVCAPFAVKRLEQEIRLRSDQVMFCLSQDEIDKELINGYNSEISGIKIASVADTLAVAANQPRGGGEFVLE